jgi:hypothetical protein
MGNCMWVFLEIWFINHSLLQLIIILELMFCWSANHSSSLLHSCSSPHNSSVSVTLHGALYHWNPQFLLVCSSLGTTNWFALLIQHWPSYEHADVCKPWENSQKPWSVRHRCGCPGFHRIHLVIFKNRILYSKSHPLFASPWVAWWRARPLLGVMSQLASHTCDTAPSSRLLILSSPWASCQFLQVYHHHLLPRMLLGSGRPHHWSLWPWSSQDDCSLDNFTVVWFRRYSQTWSPSWNSTELARLL